MSRGKERAVAGWHRLIPLLIAMAAIAVGAAVFFPPLWRSDPPSVEKDAPAVRDAVLNLNTASAEQLQQLEGIGEKKAQSIVDYREEHGSFSSREELAAIPGISENMISKWPDNVVAE